MNKIKFSFIIVLSICATTYAQNVGINNTGTTPNSSAELDLNTGNTFTSPNGKGLLIPNVALTGTGDNVTVNTPATSLFVYNTATAGASPTNVVPGFYYWNGAKWVAFGGTGSNNWSLTGNAGTTVGTNFLGTTDNNDLEFKVNNVRSGLIDIANYQTFFGYAAGLNNTAAGILNSFFGYGAGVGNTSGTGNTGIGYNSITTNATGTDNTAIGVQSLNFVTGSDNVALGTNAGFSLNSGTQNTALGFWAMNNAGLNNISSSYNTAVGGNSGISLTTGGSNTFLGYNSNLSSGAFTNITAIGANAYAGQSNALILGSISGINGAATSANVGIGTTTPADALVVTIPAGSAINAITADVTPGNGVGNALQALSLGIPNYSAIFAQSNPTVAGSGFGTSLSNHAMNAQIQGNQPYSFAIYGRVVSAPIPSGGVFGYWAANVWGSLGYYSTASAKYGAYVNGAGGTTYGNGAGRLSNQHNSISVFDGIGIGAYGDLFGGWIRGNVYGMAVKGERTSLYVDGKTIVNQPIVELTKTDDKTIVNYASVSATADLQIHGVAKMYNGIAIIPIDPETLAQFVTEDLTIIATPTGQTNGVYAELKGNQLTVKENNNGVANTKVSWIIIGKRNLDENFVPAELKDKDFDTNLRGFMHNENDNSTIGGHLWWDGQKLNTTPAPQQPK